MVTEPSRDLRWVYEDAGVRLIPIAEGAQACLDELRLGRASTPEVVLACDMEKMLAEFSKATAAPGLGRKPVRGPRPGARIAKTTDL
jgi:hypothetical protein